MRFLSTLIASTLGTLLALGILFLLFLLFVFSLTLSVDRAPDVASSSVLALDLGGPFPDVAVDDPLLRLATGTSPQDLARFQTNLRKAAADDRVAGLWLRFEGLSAPWATLEEMREALLQFKESGKPIYASASDFFMDEVDYFVATVADSIFLAPQSLFEFNGFSLTSEFYAGLLDKLAVEPQVVRAGEFKSAVEPFTRADLSPENREQLEALLADWNTVFTRAVAEQRRMTPEQVQALAAGGDILTANDARSAGLVDDLRYHDEVVDAFRTRLGYGSDEDVEIVEGGTYTHVPLEDAGIRIGDEGEIAVVYAAGSMVSGSSGMDPNPLFGGVVVGSDTFRKAMEEARESERVRAVVVRIDSPGGYAPAADEMWQAVRLAAAEKPVLVSMGGYAASGGYWLATAAETIVADPLTLTGSIGVFRVLFDTSDLFEDKLGITFDDVSTTDYADMFYGLRPLSNAEMALLQRSTDETYRTFLSRVSQSRDMTIEAVDSVAQGRVWTGLRARELGLVDSLGSLRTTIRMAAVRAGLEEGSYRLRILPRRPGVLEMLTDRLGASIMAIWTRLTTTSVERATRERLGWLSEVAAWRGKEMARIPVDIRVR